MKSVPYGWKALGQAILCKPRPLTVTARILHYTLIQSGTLIDELFYREWKKFEYRGPLFILGHQRSGTTTVHRALCSSPQMVGSTLPQMVLPSLSLWRAIDRVRQADRQLGGHLSRRINAAATRRFSSIADLHKTGLGEVEEDEFYFWSLFASSLCLNSDPETLQHTPDHLLRYPQNRDQRWQSGLLDWYGDCLRKLARYNCQIHDVAGPPWIVAKNPAFSHQIPALVSRFPDARFVIMHRDPREAIASRLNLIEKIWQTRGFQKKFTADNVDVIYRDSIRIYSGIEEQTQLIPANRLVELSSANLERDPEASLRILQMKFDLEIRRVPRAHDRHAAIDLESFGLSAGKVEHDLSRVFSRRPWETC